MAVVQISRIQIRRGQANGGTGLPQLAGGELAWAMDTQEVFIGNGAISEGAPTVGNTKILTEHDNILEIAALYQYKKNDSSIVTANGDIVQRTLQDRLDDTVSVRAFGAVGDGFVNDTAAIQRAIDQLYINPGRIGDTASRVQLFFEAGTYNISEEIRIPPYAHLIGEGIDSTIINQTGDGVVFRTVDGNSTPGNYTAFGNMNNLLRPRNISISGMTLTNSTDRSIIYLDNTDSSIFENIKFVGTYVNGTEPTFTNSAGIIDFQSGIYIRSNSAIFCNNNILFKFCIFNSTGNGMYSESDSNFLQIQNCTFLELFDAIDIGGGIGGAVSTSIENNYFDNIDRYGVRIKAGSSLQSSFGNVSRGNKFYKVGNNNQTYTNATYPNIVFEQPNNTSKDDYFERNVKLKNLPLNPFIANVQTKGMIYEDFNYEVELIETGIVPVPLIRLPIIDSCTFEIDYVLSKSQGIEGGVATRSGVFHVTANKGVSLIDGVNPPSQHFHDDFGYTGDTSVEDIRFTADLFGYTPNTTEADTMIISYTNPIGNGLAALNYTYRLLTK